MQDTLDATSVKNYIENNKDRFLQELIDWLKIPSVSAKSEHIEDVRHAAKYLMGRLEEAGVSHIELVETKGYPIVYAEHIKNPSLPTILVYGHYDVQPAEPFDLWDSPPFEPVIKNERVYARGACDDKGQAYMHVKAFEIMVKNDMLPCNVKFVIEGEEEVGSDNLEIFVNENKEKLKADVGLISDTSIISNEHPSITVGLRGMSYMEVELTGPNRDLHSGAYGGAVANPINALSRMIASLKDEDNRITIPGFYDKVAELSQEYRARMAETPHDEERMKKELDIYSLETEKGFSSLEGIGIRPTLDVNGIWGGYTGEGAKTVLPSKASAKISMRLVPYQDNIEITELFKKHIESITPDTMKVKVTTHHGGQPAVVSTQSVGFKAASAAFEEAWNKEPYPTRDGGSIPVVNLLQGSLGVDSILLGFGLDSDAIHSPNESYGLFNFYKGIETIVLFYQHYARLTTN